MTSANRAKFTVVGIGLLPEQPGHSPYDRGLWVTPKGLARFGEVEIGDRELLVSLDTDRGAAALSAALKKAAGFDLEVEPAVSPAAARDMVSVRRLPLALAVFLAILAAGVSIHALANTVQRRRRDLAVFRARIDAAQTRVVIASQATTIGFVGVVVGVPLGVVVGALPEQPGHSPYDRGLWVTRAGFDRFGEVEIGDHELLVSLDGARGDAALSAALRGRVPLRSRGRTRRVSGRARDMVSVRRLPLALAVFLAILAAGVSIHALVNTVQRRRRDLAVFRALGLTPRQARVVISSQATTIGLLGLVVGVPLGLVVGRAGWRWVARSVPFLYRAPFAVVAVIVVVPAALAVLNVVAALPARAAGRVRPAEVLRTE